MPYPFSDQSVQSNAMGAAEGAPLPASASLKPFGLSASPPDGLSPISAGVAAHGSRGRRWEGTESRWIVDLRTAVGLRGERQHMTRGVTARKG